MIRALVLVVASAVSLLACASSDDPVSGEAGGGDAASSSSSGHGGGGPGGLTEPTAGIPGCAQIFVAGDGVCRPSLDRCPTGQIPKFAEGCVPVGLQGCDPVFMENDGLCHPASSKCGAGEYPVPSEGCVSIDGAGCGTDTWGLVTEQAGDQNVDGSYAGGDSDGSRAKPWTTIADALGAVAAGKRVVIAAGTYHEAIAPTAAIDVIGRCASMVTIDGTVVRSGVNVVTAFVSPDPSSLRGVHVMGDGRGVFVSGADLTLEDVWVDHTAVEGVAAGGASKLTMHHVMVSDTQPDTNGTFGTGVDVVQGSTATIHQSFVQRASVYAFSFYGPDTTGELKDSIAEDTRGEPSDGQYGYGFSAADAVVTVTGFASLGSGAAGFAVQQPATVNVSDSLLERAKGPFSRGVDVQRTAAGGADVQIEGLAILAMDGPGVFIANAGTAVVTRTLVANGVPEQVQESDGFYVDVGSTLTVRDAAAVNNVGVGVSVRGDATFIGDGILAQDNVDSGDLDVGFGLGISEAKATLQRFAAFHCNQTGIFAYKSTLDLSDSIVWGTVPSAVDQQGGAGATAYSSQLTLSRVRFQDSVGVGVGLYASGGTLTDVVVDNVTTGVFTVRDDSGGHPLPDVSDGIVTAASSMATDVSGGWIVGVHRAGLVFAEAGGSIARTKAEGGLYGLAEKGALGVTLAKDNELSGSKKDVLEDATIATP